jgi:hypothetical protein
MRTVGSGQLRGVEQFFYNDRHAVQLPSPPAALEYRIGRRGGAASAIGVDRDKRREVIIDGGDPARASSSAAEGLSRPERKPCDRPPMPSRSHPVIAAAGT